MQMDLLSWTPPCKVLVFPHDRRVGRVRHVASKLLDKRGDTADAYWRQTVSALANQMERAGIPDCHVHREIHAFFDAVQGEMLRLTYRGQRPGGGAA